MGVSERTISRRMTDFGLSKLNFSSMSQDELDEIVCNLSIEFPKCGERVLNQILKGKGVRIRRAELCENTLRVIRFH